MSDQQLIFDNWDKFHAFVGEETIKKFKICIMREQGSSYGQIQIKLGYSKQTIQYTSCNVCPEEKR